MEYDAEKKRQKKRREEDAAKERKRTIWSIIGLVLIAIISVVVAVVTYAGVKGKKGKGKGKKSKKKSPQNTEQTETDSRLTSFFRYLKSLLDKGGITLTKEHIFKFIENNEYLSTEEKEELYSYMDYSYTELLSVIKQHHLVDSILDINPKDIIKIVLDYSIGIVGSALKRIYKNTNDFLSYIFGSSSNEDDEDDEYDDDSESSFWDMSGLFPGSDGTRKSKRKVRCTRKSRKSRK
jgi:hypothetical protein